MSKKIGIFSGTFDPVHIGHIEACLVAKGALELDQVLVMIEKTPNRKVKVTDLPHRKAMLKLALADFDSIEYFEDSAENITFENTLPGLQKKFPGSTFYMIIGSDMLKYLGDWPGAEQGLQELQLCIVLRDNKDKKAAQQEIAKLVKSHPGLKAEILPAVWSPVSSSSVKSEIAKSGGSDKLHRDVNAYITKHKLY